MENPDIEKNRKHKKRLKLYFMEDPGIKKHKDTKHQKLYFKAKHKDNCPYKNTVFTWVPESPVLSLLDINPQCSGCLAVFDVFAKPKSELKGHKEIEIDFNEICRKK